MQVEPETESCGVRFLKADEFINLSQENLFAAASVCCTVRAAAGAPPLAGNC
ncbi:MAG TPA: hypothetical protein VJT10_05855 [Steroidobacteraceae bacterium]|nr:hypothetical protein [Steroidobacteraceae bacterium]